MSDIKETLPFNFDEIYNAIVKKFEEKGYDAPYEGSNLAQLITSMAYTTSMLNANTAININETILTLAQKRPNIIQDARMLGYESGKMVSYVYELELEFQEAKKYTISKYTKFESDGKPYYYMGDDFDIDTNVGETITIQVKEGTLHTYIDEPENLRQIVANIQYFDIPYTKVERDGIDVFVTFYTQEGILSTKTKFIRSETLLLDVDDRLSKKFVRIDNEDMGTPRIYFVYSGVGFTIPRGAIIEFNVLVSSGPDGEMKSLPSITRGDIKINSYSLRIKGTVEESDQSIKDNAPLLHNTAGRAVVANDYVVVCKQHQACKEAFVFGGEDEVPKRLGNLFFSLTPNKATRSFTELSGENTEWQLDLKEDIFNNYLLDDDYISSTVDVNGNITNSGIIDNVRALNLPALEYNIRNPNYIMMDFDIKVVKYTLAAVRKDVRQKIFDLVNDYIKKLEVFESEFFKSNVINILDDYLTEITGLELRVSFQMMLNSKSITLESIPGSCVSEELNENSYLRNPGYEQTKEYSINIYFDTPYEGLYNNKMLILENLPKIDTANFIGTDGITVDFSTYTVDPNIKDFNKDKIVFFVYLGSNKIGTYTIYNNRTTYIKVKLFCKSDTSPEAVDFSQIPNSDFETPRYLDINYPSQNFKTLRNSIFKLNNVKVN